jgi:murein DD-endopeptidase MepM/ murein hydrolase activator NlpD
LPSKRSLARLFGLLLFLSLITGLVVYPAGSFQEDSRPFQLPFNDPPGPDTWLLIQAYGNTTGAYVHRKDFYNAGQGLHFGIDLAARCGYPIVAIGDGVVTMVDNLAHGAAPHNLMIDHPNGYASFYGHLLERPELTVGQRVSKGQVIAKVGDPDMTCTSRPHLHLEIRNAGQYNQAFNPVNLIAADWNTLALEGISPFEFERNLDNPRQWQQLDDQPDTHFWGQPLNNYDHAWPPAWGR